MRYKIEIKNILENGLRVDSEGNPHQEDSIYPAYNEQKDSDRLFVLCDGMGGHEAGEVASSTVCNAMSKSVFDSMPNPEGDFDDSMMQKAISDAFDALDSLSVSDTDTEKKMGTTMTFLKLHNKGCTIAHMGDSRVYHIRPGKDKDDTSILFQTTDHSLINDLIKIGELTEEEAKESKQKNIITRAMQPKMERRPKASIYSTADIKAGDYFFMCSDGMLEQMENDNVRFIFSDETGGCEEKTEMLIKATNQNRDNHSAIIVHILEVIDPLPVEKNIQPTGKITRPAPFMAEIDDDSDTDCNNDTEQDNADKAIDMPKQKLKQPVKGSRKRKNIIRYVLMFLLIVAIVAGIYFITSAISQKDRTNEAEQEPTEQDATHQQKNKTRKRTKTSQSRTNVPDKQNENNSIGEPQHGTTNANNTNSHVSESATDNAAQQGAVQKPPHKQNTLNKIPTKNNNDSENPVSSDEQQVIDAINHAVK